MSERFSVRVFKGPEQGDFCQAIERVLADRGGAIFWGEEPGCYDEEFRLGQNGNVHVGLLPYLAGASDHFLFLRLAEELSCPWLELRVQEGCLWDYSLYSGGKHLDNFSTLPEYWGEEDSWNATQRGNPALLADAWGIEQREIERYLRAWGYEEDEDTFCTLLRGKAYERDEFEYGDIWQMLDFLRALGGVDVLNPGKSQFRHRIICPPASALK